MKQKEAGRESTAAIFIDSKKSYQKIICLDICPFLSHNLVLLKVQGFEEAMFEAMSGIFCFVTVAVSFMYGTRIAWVCGKKCQFREKPETRKELLLESLPAAAVVYFFGFVVMFSFILDGLVTVIVFSLTSAIVLANMVVSMAMPELKRKPETPKDL